MARPESDWSEIETVCVANLFKLHKIDKQCKCPKCAGRTKPGRPKNVEFPELLANAVKGELKDG